MENVTMETAGEQDLESARACYPELQTESDVQLHQPDLEQLKHDRFERNRHVMETLDKRAANTAFPQVSDLNRYEKAALCIQRNYRGYLGRKRYTEFLYDKYTKEEQARLEKMLAQFEEGELLVENHKLEVLLDDNTTTRRNRSRNYLSQVITIQRAWRSYSRRKRIVDSDSDDSSIEDLEELKILHDGSEKQKMTQTNPDCSPQSEDVNVVLEDVCQTENFNNKRDSSEEKDCRIENRSSSEDKEYSPGPRFTSPAHRLVNKVRYEHDSDSLSSDYSEFSAPLKDLADNEVTIIERQQLAEGNIQQSPRNTSSNVIRKPFESDEDFSRRIRKLNFLSIAQEFAELKKVNCDILPFDLHKGQQFSESSASDTSSAPTSQLSSEMNTPSDPSDSFVQLNNGVNNLISKDLNSNINNGNVDERDNNSLSTATSRSNTSNDNLPPHTSSTDTASIVRVSKRSRDQEEENENRGDKSDVTDRGDNSYNDESEGDFDVYNIETAVPQMNWEILGQQLEQVTLHQQTLQQYRQQQPELQQQQQQALEPKPLSQRNDREEIRRKLAMGGLEEDYYGGERSYKKPNLSKRLQSGMNLQICFMNESPGDEPDPIKSSPQKSDLLQEDKTETNKLDSTDVKNSVTVGSNPDLSDNKMSVAAERNGKSVPPGAKQLADEDFFKKQARLQREAKIALAQASTMAHMQLEVEKQMKKKSPVTDIVGLPLLGDRIMSWGNKPLHEMNLAQLQVLVNDLHSQIEKLNEDLVRLLMERDELHMGQDSMLVDIEDLTRRAEDKAKKFNTQPGRKGNNSKRS